MKKQFFLYLVVGLSLFNITSFSMQSEDGALIKRKKPKCPRALSGLSEEAMEKYFSSVEPSRNVLNIEEFLSNYSSELMPTVDKKLKRVKIDSIFSTVLGSFSEDKSHIARKNITFLESIQQYSLERQYKEVPFVLFHGPYGTGKTTTASYFGELLNKKIKIFNFHRIENKNSCVLQKVITECIEKNITEDGEPCVFFLDEVDRLLCPHDFNHSNRNELVQNLINCLSKAQRINQKQEQQKYFIIAATNHTEKIEEILPLFECIEINSPNFEQRVKILKELIDDKRFSFDISTLDQHTIEDIAKRFEGISIFELNQLIDHAIDEAQNEYYEIKQVVDHTNPPLCKRHFITFESEFELGKQSETTFFSRSKELGSEGLGTNLNLLALTVEKECRKKFLLYNHSDDDSDEEFELIVDEEKPRELSCPNSDQRVEILNNFILKIKMGNTFEVNGLDQDVIENIAEAFKGDSISKLEQMFEQAARIAQEEYNKQQDPRPSKPTLLERHFINAKKLIDEKKISDQKTEESSSQDEPSSQQDWLRKKAGDIVNAIPGFFSKIPSLFPASIFSRGKNLIEKIFYCPAYKASSIIMIIFHFLLRKPF